MQLYKIQTMTKKSNNSHNKNAPKEIQHKISCVLYILQFQEIQL